MNRVIITAPFAGIAWMQVCAAKDVTDEEILEVCNRENPSGTSNGWCHVIRNDEEMPQRNPVECGNDSGRVHFLVGC